MCSFKQSKIFTVPSLGKSLILPEIGDMTKNVKQGFHGSQVKKKKKHHTLIGQNILRQSNQPEMPTM